MVLACENLTPDREANMNFSFSSISTEQTVSNLLFPVSRRQFLKLADKFKTAAERTLGSECTIQLDVLGPGKPGEAASQLSTGDLTKLTKDAWNSGTTFKLTYTPASGGTASAELAKGAKKLTLKASKQVTG
jgi:hypothetical protein